MRRREYLSIAFGGIGALTRARRLYAASGIDGVLQSGIVRRKVPAVVAMASTASETFYRGAFGVRNSGGTPVTAASIFQIASMTKAITTVAALQLVEQRKVALDEPVAKYLPKLEKLDVLEGFTASGAPILCPSKTPITLKHLLTHTSGLCYDTWDEKAFHYAPKAAPGSIGPLMFEPGARWQYGQGCDWAGRLVETISGGTLEDYFQAKIFRPLGMDDTSYILPAAKFDRLVTNWTRENGSPLKPGERSMPKPPASFNGGGGLYSTAADYTRFMQAILRKGEGILQPKTVASMMVNQIGTASAGKMRSFKPDISVDVDIQPGAPEKWGLGFLINTTPYRNGRAAGSLAWAGLFNTFYWIDPKSSVCAVIMMQFLPFVDKEAVGMLNDFEAAVYASRR